MCKNRCLGPYFQGQGDGCPGSSRWGCARSGLWGIGHRVVRLGEGERGGDKNGVSGQRIRGGTRRESPRARRGSFGRRGCRTLRKVGGDGRWMSRLAPWAHRPTIHLTGRRQGGSLSILPLADQPPPPTRQDGPSPFVLRRCHCPPRSGTDPPPHFFTALHYRLML